jgi:hypothetical protein
MVDDIKLRILVDDSAVAGLDKTFKKYEGMFKDISKTFGEESAASMIESVGVSEIGGGMIAAESTAATAATAIAPELVVLIAAILVVLVVIQKIIEFTLGVMAKISDAILGPVFDVLNMIMDILFAPLKILGVFLMTLIIPFFRIATRLSTIMIAFFGTFMDKYEQALATRLGTPEGQEHPAAAEAAAGAEAFTYMFGGIIVGLQTGLSLVIIEFGRVLLLGFAYILERLPVVGAAFTGFADWINSTAENSKESALRGAALQMEAVSALAKGVGDVTFIMAQTTELFWKNLLGTSASIEEENAGLAGSVAAFEDMVKIHVDKTTPVLGSLSETLTNAGLIISTSTLTTAGAIDSLYNAITRAEGGSNLIQALKNLATNANLAAEKVGLLAIAAGGAKSALESMKGGGGSGGMENTIVNLMGNMGNINLGTGSQVINLGR